MVPTQIVIGDEVIIASCQALLSKFILFSFVVLPMLWHVHGRIARDIFSPYCSFVWLYTSISCGSFFDISYFSTIIFNVYIYMILFGV